MSKTDFELQQAEHVVFQTQTNRQWYVIADHCLVTILITILMLAAGELLHTPAMIAILCYLALRIGHLAFILTVDLTLTNQRILVHGAPHAWSQTEIPLADIEKLSMGIGTLIIHPKSQPQKSYRIPQSAEFIQAYEIETSRRTPEQASAALPPVHHSITIHRPAKDAETHILAPNQAILCVINLCEAIDRAYSFDAARGVETQKCLEPKIAEIGQDLFEVGGPELVEKVSEIIASHSHHGQYLAGAWEKIGSR